MALGSLRQLTCYLLSSRLFATGVVLAVMGSSWATVELCSSHPWLILLGASYFCILGHCWTALRSQGLLGILPSWVTDALGRPVFESARIAAADGVLVGVNTVRLLLLAIGDLDEEQRAQVLEELSEDYRRDCFQKPSFTLLPRWLQHLLVGESDWKHDWALDYTLPSDIAKSSRYLRSSDDAREDAIPSRQTSNSSVSSAVVQSRIADLLTQLRTAETVARKVEMPKLQKVLHEKISDYTVAALRGSVVHGGKRRVDDTRKAVNKLVSTAATADLSEGLSRMMSPRTIADVSENLSLMQDLAEVGPQIFSRACSLTWAVMVFPLRVASAAISVSVQGFGLVAISAFDRACSRRKSMPPRSPRRLDPNGMIMRSPRELLASAATKRQKDTSSGSGASD